MEAGPSGPASDDLVMSTPDSPGEPTRVRDRRVLYAGAIALEALVLLAIWLIQSHFGA